MGEFVGADLREVLLAGACLGVDGKPLPCANRNSGAESRGGDEVVFGSLFKGAEPAKAEARACVSRPIQGGGGEWRGTGWELFQNRGRLHPSESGQSWIGWRNHGEEAEELAVEKEKGRVGGEAVGNRWIARRSGMGQESSVWPIAGTGNID